MTRRLPFSLFDLAVCLGLILSVLAIYAQTAQFEFIASDDELYVSHNPVVQSGLTYAGVLWSLTASVAANWLPVTLISHMLDVQLFGLDSGMHHLMNAFYHALAALLLFFLLHRATGARWPSAFAAFVFAVHPTHVESVAWISERKDVLSAFFLFLALYAYLRYVDKPGVGRYLLVAGAFCLDLMSKPMVVTFPFVLLLFDFWPLRRPPLLRLLWEKLPFFALSAADCFITYRVQRATGAVEVRGGFDVRIVKALISYGTYLRLTIWPARLAVLYPYPKILPALQAILALAILLAISAIVVNNRRTRPYLAVGWFWFLGTLVPVIGLVQVGVQAHADRFTYIPMVGLSIMIGWGAADLVAKWPRAKLPIAAAAIASCALFLALAARQTAYWQNSETLFQHAIDVTGENWWAESNLGGYLTNFPERRGEAIDHLRIALRLNPNDSAANNDLGACLLRSDLGGDSIPYFQAALHLKPNLASAHFNLAVALEQDPGREAEAVSQYEAGLRSSPNDAEGHRHYGMLLAKIGQTTPAISELETAQRLRPDNETAALITGLRDRRR